MSTADHIIAAVGQLRSSWSWLKEATVPGPTRRQQHHLTGAARRQLDREASAERADRHALLVSKRVPTGHTPAPTNVSAIDARARIAESVDSLAWQMASHLRTRKYQASYRPDGRTADTTVTAALDWITINVVNVDDHDFLTEAYECLIGDVQLAQVVSGTGPPRRPFAAECPACGRRSLTWDCSSPDYREWSVQCGNGRCRCSGVDCPCKLPERRPGMVHLWLEAGWERFAEQLRVREAS